MLNDGVYVMSCYVDVIVYGGVCSLRAREMSGRAPEGGQESGAPFEERLRKSSGMLSCSFLEVF